MEATPLPPQTPPTPPEAVTPEPAPEVFISQATQKTPPPPKLPVKPWRYLLVIPPAVALVYGIVTDYGPGLADTRSFYLIAFIFKLPFIMALTLAIIACIEWARQKIKFGWVAVAFAITVPAYFVPAAFTYWVRWDETRSLDVYMHKAVSQMHYDIYLPAGFEPQPTVTHLLLDGPSERPSYINPKTGTNNLGPEFSAPGKAGRLVIYDKRNIPEDFGLCAPDGVRDGFESSLKLIKEGGCNKVVTTPLGRTVYAAGSDQNDRPYFVVDIDNSRIVFDGLPGSASPVYSADGRPDFSRRYINDTWNMSGNWTVYDKFAKAVDSFHKVPLSDIEFATSGYTPYYYKP